MLALILGAIITAIVHTASGPDHYLPIIALGKSNGWTMRQITLISLAAGALHVGTTILLGLLAIFLGMQTGLIESLSFLRADLAAWSLMVFGLVYTVWGIRYGQKHSNQRGAHQHHKLPSFLLKRLPQKSVEGQRPKAPESTTVKKIRGPGFVSIILLVIFAFGPVEPLIPLLMIPAANYGIGAALLIALIFAVATIGTIVAIVVAASFGLRRLPTALHRYSHSIAGFVLILSASAMLLGL